MLQSRQVKLAQAGIAQQLGRNRTRHATGLDYVQLRHCGRPILRKHTENCIGRTIVACRVPEAKPANDTLCLKVLKLKVGQLCTSFQAMQLVTFVSQHQMLQADTAALRKLDVLIEPLRHQMQACQL